MCLFRFIVLVHPEVTLKQGIYKVKRKVQLAQYIIAFVLFLIQRKSGAGIRSYAFCKGIEYQEEEGDPSKFLVLSLQVLAMTEMPLYAVIYLQVQKTFSKFSHYMLRKPLILQCLYVYKNNFCKYSLFSDLSTQ